VPAVPRRRTNTRAITVGVIAAVGALGLLVLVSWLGSRGDVDLRFADEFEVGQAERLAREIDDRGPFLFRNPAGADRHVYIQHLGDDPEKGWLTVGARAPGQEDESCYLEVDGDGFVDPCSGEEYPAEGDGLTRYPTEVRGGTVYVDLRSPTSG
jgi:hypothetical protein